MVVEADDPPWCWSEGMDWSWRGSGLAARRGIAMDKNEQTPQRRYPAHPMPIERHNQTPVVHVTVCASGRKAVLTNDAVHQALRDRWPAATHWRVGTYVIMPDHVHLFCVPGILPIQSIKRWVKYWKRLVSIQFPGLHPLWQRDCWDTQMRTLEQYQEKLAYVRQNPVRRGLVGRSDDWPFAGELNTIRW
jgi:putative transposase